MLIRSVRIAKLKIPLIRPFITALRRADYIEDIVVIIETECGKLGYGSAAATPVITGDSQESMIYAIKNIIAPKLVGKCINEFDRLLNLVQDSLVNNTSAKAAVDIALYDLIAKQANLPLYKFLGGNQTHFKSVITVSVNNIENMVTEAQLYVSQGFECLKIKVGLNYNDDIERLKAIRKVVGNKIKIITDANQGWTPKNALQLIRQLTKLDLAIELIEQPVKALDIDGLKFIRDNSILPIFADESIFSPRDALQILTRQAADGLNIKLMKSGGIYNATKIYGMASSFNIPCMAGCMLESPIGLTAMASFISDKDHIKFIDLDPLFMLKENPVLGGIQLDGVDLYLADKPGLGIAKIDNLEFV